MATYDLEKYTDKYFLRSKKILEAEGINPVVRYQVFARADQEKVDLTEAVEFIKGERGNKVKIYALPKDSKYTSCEPLVIESPN